MKEILSLLIIVGLFGTPQLVRAFLFIPTANLVIRTNTTLSDGVFIYHLFQAGFEIANWQTSTISGTGEYALRFLPAHPDDYILYQEQQDGVATSIECASQNSTSSIDISPDQATISLHAGDVVTCSFQNSPQPLGNRTFLIPGIMGTELRKGSDLLWPNILRMLSINNDRFMDPLAFTDDRNPLDFSIETGEVISNPNRAYNYSERLIAELQSKSFSPALFPYDWRKSIESIAQDLKSKIDSLAPTGSGKKIDVVAHSQGGLVIKYLLYTQPEYRAKIGKLIFVGTPHLGAPKATKALLYGDAMGVDLLGLGLDPQEIKRIGQNMPSVYELMPSEEYFNHIDVGYLGTTEKVGFLSGVEKINIYNYSATKQALKDKGLNSSLVDASQVFHNSELDNFNFDGTGIDAYNIVGCQDATIGRIFLRSNGKYRIEYVAGDGTVPLVSAKNVNTGHTYYALETEHGTMLTGSGTREQIESILGGSTDVATNNMTTNRSDCHFGGEQISAHSPVNLHIYDENGNHVGPTPNGGFDYQIPHVQYDVLDDQKFAFLPPGHTYRIELPATAAGSFDFYATKIEDGHSTSGAYYHDVPITMQSKGLVQINANNTQPIQMDANGDGVFERVVAPTSVLTEAQSVDVIAPITQVTVVGDQGEVGWYKSNVTVNFSATDSAQDGSAPSGILSTMCSVDAGPWALCTSKIFSSEGAHLVKIYSIDKAGNSEQLQELKFTIDKTAPEAVFSFNVRGKDIVVTAQDALDSSPAIVDNGDIVHITDKAGNVTVVSLSEKDRRKKLKAELVSLSYNGVPQDISKNKFSYIWDYDKNANLKKLDQQAKSKKDFNVSADYNGSTTKVEGKDDAGKIKQTYPALKLLQIKTNKGDLDWSLL